MISHSASQAALGSRRRPGASPGIASGSDPSERDSRLRMMPDIQPDIINRSRRSSSAAGIAPRAHSRARVDQGPVRVCPSLYGLPT